jgi:transcriptional regulator with XRE-family HTH domain
MSDITRDYSFGGWVRYLRVEKGLTLRAAADKLGMDPGNLSKLERSELAPPCTAHAVKRICKKLGLSEDNFVFLKSLAFQHHLSVLKTEFSEKEGTSK